MHDPAVVLVLLVVAAGTLAGLGAACGDTVRTKVLRRRQLVPAAEPADWVLRDPGLAVVVNAALSTLKQLLAPRAHTLIVNDNWVAARFERPAHEPPSAPWKLAPGWQVGSSWTADTAALRDHPTEPAPTCVFVTVGSTEGASVLLDLLAPGGMVSVQGEPDMACRVINATLFELASNPWSRDAEIVTVGFAGEVVTPEPDRVRSLSTLAELDSPPASADTVQVVVLAHPPHGDDAERVRGLLDDERPVAVLCLGASPSSTWTWVAGSGGTLMLYPIGLEVTPIVEDVETVQRKVLGARGVQVNDVFSVPAPRNVHEEDATRPVAHAQRATHPAQAGLPWETPVAGVSGPVPGAPTEPEPRQEEPRLALPDFALPAAWRESIRTLRAPVLIDAHREQLWPAAVDVRLLGPLRVAAFGTDVARHHPAVAELILGTVHPRGVSDSTLASVLHMRPPTDDHLWLDLGSARLPLVRDADGAWRIPADVRVDWHLFRELSTANEPRNELVRLQSALALIRGQLGAGDFLGEHAREALSISTTGADALVVHAVRRAAHLAAESGALDKVEWTLRQGLLLLPRTEGLWRALLLFRYEHDRSALAGTVEQMLAALSAGAGHARLSNETSELLSRLRRERALWLA